MDPTSNLKEQLEIAERVLSPEDNPPRRNDFVRLAELVSSLHEWMVKGGFKPAQWCLHGCDARAVETTRPVVAAIRALDSSKLLEGAK